MNTQSREELMLIARSFYPPGIFYDAPGYNASLQRRRFWECWRSALENPAGWDECRARIRSRVQPAAAVSNMTMPGHGGGLRMGLYFPADQAQLRYEDAFTETLVLGCVSVLAPLYIIHGVRVEHRRGHSVSPHTALYGILPDPYCDHARIMSEEIERVFGYAPVSAEDAQSIVQDVSIEPNDIGGSTLMQALFCSDPTNVF